MRVLVVVSSGIHTRGILPRYQRPVVTPFALLCLFTDRGGADARTVNGARETASTASGRESSDRPEP